MATTQKDFKVKNGIVAGSKIQTAVPSTTIAPLNIPHGNAPSAPVNGDVWTTTAGMYVQVNNATVGPIGAAISTFNSITTTSGAATAATLWSDVTTGSIAIGAGLTTGALNLATVGTGATPIGIGHTNAITTITGTVNLPSSTTKVGNTSLIGGVTGNITFPATAGTLALNPLTTNGDLIYGVGSTATRLGIGTVGQALVVNTGATAPAWSTLTLENLPGAFTKKAVRAATTANIATLAGGAPNTIDGVTLAANDRILVKNQSTTSQNGIYTVTTLGTGANGTWTRATDADASDEIAGALVNIDEGTTQASQLWSNTFKPTDTLGTTAMAWYKMFDLSQTLGVANGGTGLTGTPTNGQIPIGNGSGFSLATLTQGSGITITNGVGTVTIAASGSSGGATISDTAPGSPTAGQLWWESDSGKMYVYYTDANTSQWVEANSGAIGPVGPQGVQGPVGNSMIPYQRAGSLSVDVGVTKFRFPLAGTILGVSATVGSAPTGSAVILDVNKNGTTIFTTQANRPQIAASSLNTASEVTNMDVTSIAAGDFITVDVDQIGSTFAGSDLTVLVRYSVP